ncbi:MAG TPA: hypothetical protein VFZ09_28685 [Archangium sp.]|uniref:hypothetical protein n=1 Tax=Archangium sp. TaxID=1872627 RepID=UPI002E33EB4A|nr:hypothetical protein [Archangium sp.]HEX5750242.1 hypothetical protein [Archangium sp.]
MKSPHLHLHLGQALGSPGGRCGKTVCHDPPGVGHDLARIVRIEDSAYSLMARPGPPLARLAWLVLRYGRTGELADRLPEWTALLAQVQAAPEGTEHLRVAIRYLIWIGDKRSRQATGQVLHSVMDEQQAEELMRSYGEQLVERGLKRGRAQDVVRILTVRGIPLDEQSRQRILMCRDLALLDQWFDRALNATRLGDVLDQ